MEHADDHERLYSNYTVSLRSTMPHKAIGCYYFETALELVKPEYHIRTYRKDSDGKTCFQLLGLPEDDYSKNVCHPLEHRSLLKYIVEMKTFAHELVPTITCTSSNVVQTILEAFSQLPYLKIWYGPDSYMGANIRVLLEQITKMTDEEIAETHPAHYRDSIRSLLPRLLYYQGEELILFALIESSENNRQ